MKTLRQLSTDQVPMELDNISVEVRRLLKKIDGEMSRKAIQEALGLKHTGSFRDIYLEPALRAQLIEMKYPNKPNHPKQRYSITDLGKKFLKDENN